MSITTDENDPRLNSNEQGQNEVYLVLSAEERERGFVAPVRYEYLHLGLKPTYPLLDLTEEQKERYKEYNYVKYEKYPEEDSIAGKFWTEEKLKGGCGGLTLINSKEIAETYAADPEFYGSTFCMHCNKHLPVHEFVWFDGTQVGSIPNIKEEPSRADRDLTEKEQEALQGLASEPNRGLLPSKEKALAQRVEALEKRLAGVELRVDRLINAKKTEGH